MKALTDAQQRKRTADAMIFYTTYKELATVLAYVMPTVCPFTVDHSITRSILYFIISNYDIFYFLKYLFEVFFQIVQNVDVG